ncbi:MAG: HNH endonuclease [Caldilineaceae bacterium]|nr:HNH endonuclease [Caldilineaceae bacterium]
MPTLHNRFWSKAQRMPNGCLEWTHGTSPGGYGAFWLNGGMRRAPRVAWELEVGEIPDGLCVLHKCDNPKCVDIAHLFLGTMKDNSIDCVNKGRNKNPKLSGEKHPMAKLTSDDAREIYLLTRYGLANIEIAAIYGTCKETVSHIKNGRQWATVTRDL